MKLKSDSMANPMQPNAGRRSFFWKAGAAFSATLASVAVGATRLGASEPGSADEQRKQLDLLEDTHAIRGLHYAYGNALNQRQYEEVVHLFADDSEVYFNGGLFVGKDHGVRRLYVEHFGRRLTAGEDAPVHAYLLDRSPQQDSIEVAPDRKTAKARFHCLIRVEAALTSNLPLIEMARQQGQGIRQWWEGGVFENAYVQEDGVWKIKQLAYHAFWQADQALGGSRTQSSPIPSFSSTYPEHPAGPDQIITRVPAALCAETEMAMAPLHFAGQTGVRS